MNEWIDYLKSVDSPTLSNAIELLNVRKRSEGFTPLQIRCLFPDLGRMVGYAVTAQVETMTPTEPYNIDGHLDLYKLVAASPKPAVVVLQEIGGFPDFAAHCGEVMATFFTRCGAVGLVSDCAVRDIAEVHALNFRYFARGTAASHGYFRIVRSGVTVNVCGMSVKPGDLLHGDENGLLSVPEVDQQALKQAVDDIRSREKKIMDYVKSPEFDLSKFKQAIAE